MKKQIISLAILFLIIYSLTGCAAFRSDIDGMYSGNYESVKKTPKIIFFDLYHYKQDLGMDAIPKLLDKPGIWDFDDVFQEALKQISNINKYQAFTNLASDVGDFEKREKRKKGIDTSDFVIKLEIHRNKSFTKHILAEIVSIISLDLIPMGYSWEYTINVNVIKKDVGSVAEYSRSASVTNWHQILLFTLYPFHPEELKNEEIYLQSLVNIFKQIENENVLK